MTYVVGNRWGSAKHYGNVGDDAEITMASVWMGTGPQYQWAGGACIDRATGKPSDPKNCPPPTLRPISSLAPAKPTQSWLESLFAHRPAPVPGMPAASIAGSFTTPLIIAGAVIGGIILISAMRKKS